MFSTGLRAIAVFKRIGLCLLGWVVFCTCPTAWAGYEYYDPSPVGILRIRRPTLVVRVRTTEDTQIVSVSVTLNGKPVKAVYAAEKQAVVYQPSQPLPAGQYQVKCHIEFSDADALERQWQFTISSGALSALPPPTVQQQSVLQVINALRRAAGHPPFSLNPSLNAAAQAHSNYVLVNRSELAHEEQPGKPGFTGAEPQARATAFGYDAPLSEDISEGYFSATGSAVSDLFDAPYHRLPFLTPGAGEIGVGVAGQTRSNLILTLDFGVGNAQGVVISPYDGQLHVPTSWKDEEFPDPLRIHPGAKRVAGYVILFAWVTLERQRIKVTGATLTTERGEAVSIHLNTPDNDPFLTEAALIIPQKPLRPNTKYEVHVTASTVSGTDISRRWTFTTGQARP